MMEKVVCAPIVVLQSNVFAVYNNNVISTIALKSKFALISKFKLKLIFRER